MRSGLGSVSLCDTGLNRVLGRSPRGLGLNSLIFCRNVFSVEAGEASEVELSFAGSYAVKGMSLGPLQTGRVASRGAPYGVLESAARSMGGSRCSEHSMPNG